MSEAAISRARETLTQSLRPVRPLPSDQVLVSVLVAAFLVFSLAVAWPLGFYGWRGLSTARMLPYYLLIAVCVVGLAMAVVQEMIPGSRRRVSAPWLLIGTLVMVAALVAWLFPTIGTEPFVRLGVPCLLVGCSCAAVAGPLTWAFVRRGFAVSLSAAALTAGVFAAFTGVAVLALHCPIHNASHIVVWHLGAVVIASAVAYLLSRLAR